MQRERISKWAPGARLVLILKSIIMRVTFGCDAFAWHTYVRPDVMMDLACLYIYASRITFEAYCSHNNNNNNMML